MSLCYGFLVGLFISVSTPIFSANFDVNEAIDTLSLLQGQLDKEQVTEREIKDIREQALGLRAQALECVDEVQPQVETLNLEVEALQQINPEVDIEIFDRLANARSLLRLVDAKLKNCYLSVVRSTRVIDVAGKLLNEITTELLSKKGLNIIDAFKTIPNQIALLPNLIFDEAIQRINQETFLVLILFLLLGFGFGFLLGGQIKKIQYTEFFKKTDRTLILDLRKIFQPFGRVQSPFIFASLGTALAIVMSLSVSASESLIIRLVLSPFIIAVFQVFINWVCTA